MKTVSKREVKCIECERVIPPGEVYVRDKGFTEENEGYNVATCIPCDSLYKELQASGHIYDRHFGALFDVYDEGLSADRKERHRLATATVARGEEE